MRRQRENRDQDSPNAPQKRQKFGEDGEGMHFKDGTNLDVTNDHPPESCPHENHPEETLPLDLVLDSHIELLSDPITEVSEMVIAYCNYYATNNYNYIRRTLSMFVVTYHYTMITWTRSSICTRMLNYLTVATLMISVRTRNQSYTLTSLK